jgi:hypothetical protein
LPNESLPRDLKLWLYFLKQAVNGISLNLLTFCHPTHIGCSNASEHGIGGFSATTGIAWRWEIPLKLRWRATLNVLEYLAGSITLWMEIQVGKAPNGSCFSLKLTALRLPAGSGNQTLMTEILYTWILPERLLT